MERQIWVGAYDQGWVGRLPSRAFSHPAKISFGLAARIYAYLLERGYLQKGATVLDCFAGISGTAFHAMANGLSWIGVELEPRFVLLSNGGHCDGTIEEAEREVAVAATPGIQGWFLRLRVEAKYFGPDGQVWHGGPEGIGWATEAAALTARPAIVAKEGDRWPVQMYAPGYWEDPAVPAHTARRMVCTRPAVCGKTTAHEAHHVLGTLEYWRQRYGLTGAMLLQGDSRRLGAVLGEIQTQGIVCSPPYACDTIRERAGHLEHGRLANKGLTQQRYGLMGDKSQPFNGYGAADGQLGVMPPGTLAAALVTSPPYCEGLSKEHTYADHTKRDKDSHRRIMTEKGIADPFYGVTAGNLGNLPAGQLAGVVTNPPYAVDDHGGSRTAMERDNRRLQRLHPERVGRFETCFKGGDQYGQTEGQLGASSTDTFWSASAEILRQCHQFLVPQAVACFIVKDYLRDGQRVPFSQQWSTLCEATGFQLVEWIQASLITDYGTEPTLFGEQIERKVKRTSFFRRLAERRYAPDDPRRIDHEDVLICRKT